MSVKVRLSDLAPGATFDDGLLSLRILERRHDGKTLVVTDKPIGDRTFTTLPFGYQIDDDYKANNFALSTLMKDLNDVFLTDLLSGAEVKKFGIRADDVATTSWSLEDHEGGEGYAPIACKVAILSQTEYLKYINAGLLPEECWDGWEWTRTPYASYARNARIVNSDGRLNGSYACNGFNGVRPAFYLESGTLVSIEDDQADLSDQALLSEFTSRQLVEEVLRRIDAGEVDGDDE